MDIQIRGQFPAATGLSVYPDRADPDIWITGQVRGSPDISCYPTRYLINQAPGVQARVLTATSGTLTLTGGTAALTYAPGTTGYTLTADGGALTFTAGAATFQVGRVIQADPGALVLSGGSATLTGPVVEATGQQPAGRRKRRILVQIDGRDWEVNSPQEAIDLLRQARERVPEVVARTVKKAVEQKTTPVLPAVEVVSAPREVRAEVKLFNQAVSMALKSEEIRALLLAMHAIQIENDDEEVAILLLH